MLLLVINLYLFIYYLVTQHASSLKDLSMFGPLNVPLPESAIGLKLVIMCGYQAFFSVNNQYSGILRSV